jgi:hypothetical protein
MYSELTHKFLFLITNDIHHTKTGVLSLTSVCVVSFVLSLLSNITFLLMKPQLTTGLISKSFSYF